MDPATYKQAMMDWVQTRSVRHRTTSDRPLGNNRALLEINHGNVALTINNIAHGHVHFFSGWLHRHARGITARHFDAAHHFGRLGINDVDRSATRYMVVRAGIGYRDASLKCFQGVRCEDFNGGIKEMGIRIVSSVISAPICIAKSGQRDGVGYLIRCPVDRDHTAVFQVHPDFVGIGQVDGFFGTRREGGLVNYLACFQVHNDERVIVLAGNKQALALDVYRDAVHVALGRQWDRLD